MWKRQICLVNLSFFGNEGFGFWFCVEIMRRGNIVIFVDLVIFGVRCSMVDVNEVGEDYKLRCLFFQLVD